MNDELKLLSCPLCGGEASAHAPTCNQRSEYRASDRAFPTVQCNDCMLQVWGADWDQSCLSATAKWNTRAALPAPGEGVGVVDPIPLMMAKQACGLISALCIGELHIPEADARLDQISDMASMLNAHLMEIDRALVAAGVGGEFAWDFDRLKYPLIGEFKFSVGTGVDEDGEDTEMDVTVPWTTIKDILKAALKAQNELPAPPLGRGMA